MGIGYGLARIGQGIGKVDAANRERLAEERQRKLEDLLMQRQTEDRARKLSLEEKMQQREDADYQYQTETMRPLQKRMLEAQIAAMQQKGQPPAPKERPLPTSAIEKMVGVDNLRSAASNVQTSLEDAIRDKVDATGRAGGVLPTPTWWKNLDLTPGSKGRKGGDRGMRTRNIINQLKGTLAKERAGTAMSPAELNLLESYVPSDNDDEAQALSKAKDFIMQLDQIKANRINAYKKYGAGYNMPDDEAPEVDRLEANLPNRHD